jgi:outer membrane protein assembly factor BamB
MRRFLIYVSAVVFAAASGTYVRSPAEASPSPGGDWKQAGFDSTHSSFNPDETTITAAAVASLHLLWSKGPATPMVIEHGHVIACRARCFSRLSATGGTYRIYQPFPNWDGVGVGEGLLFAETYYGKEWATVSLSTGHAGWGAISGGHHLSGPVYHAGRVFGTDDFNHVFALDAATGARVWKTTARADFFTVPSSPTVAFNRVYVAWPTQVQAFREDNGYFRWLATLPSPRSLVAGAGSVFVSSNAGTTALDPITGQQRWNVPAAVGSLAVDADTVYVAASGSLTALDASTGALHWQTPISTNFTPPSIAGGLVWTNNGGTLTALDRATGSLAWSNSDHRVFGAPIVGDGVVAVGCDAPPGGLGVCVFGL